MYECGVMRSIEMNQYKGTEHTFQFAQSERWWTSIFVFLEYEIKVTILFQK